MTTGRINQVNGGTSGNEPSIFGVSHRERTTAREPSPFRARQVRMKELPLHSHRGLRGSASHPRPTDEVRLELESHHAVREREVSKRTPFITLGRSTRGGCREATTRGKILNLHHRHSAEGSTEVQGNAPLLSVTHGEKETPESCYPLSHIRQDERAGRDSQEAFAQGASSGEGLGAADSPATTTAALLNRSLHTNLARDRIPGPIIRTRHQDAGRRGKIPHNNNRGATRAGPFTPIPVEIGFQVPSFPPPTSSRRGAIHHRATESLATTTAELLERVPSHQSRERSDPGSRRSLSSSRSERATHHRAERSFA